MKIETLADLLEQLGTQTEIEALRNAAGEAMKLTETVGYTKTGKVYRGDIDAIVRAARQLADMVSMALEDIEAVQP